MTLADTPFLSRDSNTRLPDVEPAQPQSSGGGGGAQVNVGPSERQISMASGAVLALLGLARRDMMGVLIAGIGGGLIYRGATGHCPMYEALELNTADGAETQQREQTSVHIAQSLLIDKPAEELYRYWRDLDNLPRILSHV